MMNSFSDDELSTQDQQLVNYQYWQMQKDLFDLEGEAQQFFEKVFKEYGHLPHDQCLLVVNRALWEVSYQQHVPLNQPPRPNRAQGHHSRLQSSRLHHQRHSEHRGQSLANPLNQRSEKDDVGSISRKDQEKIENDGFSPHHLIQRQVYLKENGQKFEIASRDLLVQHGFQILEGHFEGKQLNFPKEIQMDSVGLFIFLYIGEKQFGFSGTLKPSKLSTHFRNHILKAARLSRRKGPQIQKDKTKTALKSDQLKLLTIEVIIITNIKQLHDRNDWKLGQSWIGISGKLGGTEFTGISSQFSQIGQTRLKVLRSMAKKYCELENVQAHFFQAFPLCTFDAVVKTMSHLAYTWRQEHP